MDDRQRRRRLHEIYPHANKMNLNYWERLQRVLDSTGTRGQNLQVRKKWIERQNLTNYRNEFDRLVGEMSHLKPELRAEAARKLLDDDKIKALGDYIPEKREETEPPIPRRRPGRPAGSRAPGPRSLGPRPQAPRTQAARASSSGY